MEDFLWPEVEGIDIHQLYFQQGGAPQVTQHRTIFHYCDLSFPRDKFHVTLT